MLGRRTKRTHPSAGQTQWQYDPAGNLTKQIMSSGESIDYTYNYNQLTNVSYSDRHWNNVWYEYGGAGSGNQTGRLIKQQDATGVQEFEYGNMGEMIRNRHTYVVPNSEPFTLTTEWEYDSWNRVKQIIYPDNEVVTYTYNLGGLLNHVEGNKPNIGQTIYIDKIEYDHYEQRTAVYNGNQTTTYYTYDPEMRRMTHLRTENPNGDLLKLEYNYDPAGNITKIENTGMDPYVQDYTYDDNYQLKDAHGDWGGQIGYELTMQYSPAGRIENKKLGGDRIDNNGTYPINYDNAYTYGVNGNPYALEHIIDNNTGEEHYFDWDKKGNMTYHFDKNQGNERRLCWTEDNRMQGMSDKNNGAWYNYDATGERNLKLTGQTMHVNQNGQDYYTPIFDQQTLYANPLITINDKGYTKHYFEESKRICSKIGSGGLIDIGGNMEGISQGIEEIRDMQKDGVVKTFDICMQIYPYINTNNLYKTIVQPYENPMNPDEPSFYYHSDHLGSASFLTDRDGYETQQLVYLPYGEDWVDMKYNTSQYDTPYKFNGKEKDEETGYNNYGARYYYDWASIWLSVDPMSDKYPHLKSYNYCANNPVMLIDPDGREMDDPPSSHPLLIGFLLEKWGGNHNLKQAGYLMNNTNNAMHIKTNLNVVATNFQVNIGKAIGAPDNIKGSPQNAIRHTLWNALMTRDLGVKEAIRASNAHEPGWDLNSSQRSFPYSIKDGSRNALNKADQVCDLLNNVIGRKIGSDNPNADNKTLAGKVMKEYYENGLYTTKDNNGKIEVVKTKITKAQYDAAMGNIAKKLQHGLEK